MSKMIVVERCLECPYQSDNCKMCMRMLRVFDHETGWDTPFLEWCPLGYPVSGVVPEGGLA